MYSDTDDSDFDPAHPTGEDFFTRFGVERMSKYSQRKGQSSAPRSRKFDVTQIMERLNHTERSCTQREAETRRGSTAGDTSEGKPDDDLSTRDSSKTDKGRVKILTSSPTEHDYKVLSEQCRSLADQASILAESAKTLHDNFKEDDKGSIVNTAQESALSKIDYELYYIPLTLHTIKFYMGRIDEESKNASRRREQAHREKRRLDKGSLSCSDSDME